MKRSGMPQRKQPLKRTGIKRSNERKRAAIKASKWGVRRQEAQFRKDVAARAEGMCEACKLHWLPACDGRYAHAHHVVPRSEGVGWPGLHEPANGLGVSMLHHEWIHGHTREARALGLLAHRGTVPENEPEE